MYRVHIEAKGHNYKLRLPDVIDAQVNLHFSPAHYSGQVEFSIIAIAIPARYTVKAANIDFHSYTSYTNYERKKVNKQMCDEQEQLQVTNVRRTSSVEEIGRASCRERV